MSIASPIALCYFALVLIGLFATLAIAQAESQPVEPPEKKRWEQLTEILAQSPKPESVRAGFIQKRTSLLLDKPVVSQGRFVAKGQAARLSLTTPSPVEMRFDDKLMQIYYPDDNVLEVYRIPPKSIAITAGRPDPKSLAIDFKLSDLIVDKDSNMATLKLEPKGAARKHMQRLTLVFNARLGLIISAKSIDTAGDQTDMSLSEVKTNAKVKDSEIMLDVPDDARVEYPEGQPVKQEDR